MHDSARQAHNLIRKALKEVDPPLLYGPDNKPLAPSNPLYPHALAKYRAQLHRLIDKVLQSVEPKQLCSLQQLEQALRTALERAEITFHLDTGKLDIPDTTLGPVKITGPIPVYSLVKGLAVAIVALKLPKWLSRRATRGTEPPARTRKRAGKHRWVWFSAKFKERYHTCANCETARTIPPDLRIITSEDDALGRQRLVQCSRCSALENSQRCKEIPPPPPLDIQV